MIREQATSRSAESESEILASIAELALPDPLQLVSSSFRNVAIIGVGLIGGSIGLKLKSMDHPGMIVGCDNEEVLNEALIRGAIDNGVEDLRTAVQDADLVVLCTPVDVTLKLLPEVLRAVRAGALVTDTCPVKVELAKSAATVSSGAHYVGGHPMAGSDRRGISNADPGMFESAYWIITPHSATPAETRESLVWWARMLGAYPLTMTPERHDWIVSRTTHVPLIATLALTSWVAACGLEEPLLLRLATGSFRDITFLASLPREVWEGPLSGNRVEIGSALKEFRRVLDSCIMHFHNDTLGETWRDVYEFQRKMSREKPGDWDANCELIVTASDRPGSIAKIASLLAMNDINIRDIGVMYVRERKGGSLRVTLESRADARRAVELLKVHGFSARQKL